MELEVTDVINIFLNLDDFKHLNKEEISKKLKILWNQLDEYTLKNNCSINIAYSKLICNNQVYFYDFIDTFKNVYPEEYEDIKSIIDDKTDITIAYLINEE